MIVSYYLTAPDSYRRALPEVVAKVVNGCGPGGWKFDIVPDTILLLPITESCNIHDWCYAEGTTEYDKTLADSMFLTNLEATIDHAAEKSWFSKILRPHRLLRAREYYEAVHLLGHDAYWAGKEKP